MFERMTDETRRVIVLARNEAVRLDHETIEPLDLLAGLILQGGIAAQALAAQDYDIVVLRGEELDEEPVSDLNKGFASSAGKALNDSLGAAISEGSYRDTRHLLVALLDSTDVQRELTRNGVSLVELRDTANALAKEQAEGKAPGPPEVVPGRESDADE